MLSQTADPPHADAERALLSHVGILRGLGLLVLICLAFEIATGVLLMVYYRPSISAAYYSTGIITDEVRVGWLIRSTHRWGADLVILLSFLHFIQVYFSRAYQPPLQLNWTVGVALLVLTLTAGFTGTLLPWDQYAYWYTDSARATISGVPVVGSILLRVIWGGWEIGEEVLLRFYAFHVGVVPWLLIALLGPHLVTVWRFGVKRPAWPWLRRSQSQTLISVFVADLFIAVLLMGGVLISVAVFFPPVLLERADPLSPLSNPQPRWYLLPVRELVRDLPGWRAALSVAVFLVILLLVPVLDSRAEQPVWKIVLQRAAGVLVVGVWVFLGVLGYLR